MMFESAALKMAAEVFPLATLARYAAKNENFVLVL